MLFSNTYLYARGLDASPMGGNFLGRWVPPICNGGVICYVKVGRVSPHRLVLLKIANTVFAFFSNLNIATISIPPLPIVRKNKYIPGKYNVNLLLLCTFERENYIERKKSTWSRIKQRPRFAVGVRLPEPVITSAVGQAHPTKHIIAIRPHVIPRYVCTRSRSHAPPNTTSKRQQQQNHIWMVPWW